MSKEESSGLATLTTFVATFACHLMSKEESSGLATLTTFVAVATFACHLMSKEERAVWQHWPPLLPLPRRLPSNILRGESCLATMTATVSVCDVFG
jgi:hypothetical protein